MKAFIEPLQELSGYEDMTKAAMQPGLVTISGCIDAQKPHMIYTLGRTRSRRLIVTFHEQKAKELYDDYRFFDPSVVYYPAKDVLFYQSDIRGNLLTAERISALRAIHENEQVTVITTFDALMNTMPRDAQVWDSVLHIAQGDTLDLDALVEQLVRMGYERQYQVDNIGQFALRGGILDIFPLTEENPVRIELWDDEVDTLRTFDVESQKSIENIEKLVVYPACELVLSTEEKAEGIRRLLKEAEAFSDKLRKEMKTEEAYRALSQAKELAQEWEELSETAGMDAFLSYFCRERWSLLDYFDPADTFVFFDELSRSAERGRQTELEFSESMKQRLEMGYILPGQMNELFGYKEIMGRLEKYSCCAVSALDIKTCGLKSNGQFGIHVKSVSAYNNSFELLIADLKKYKKNGYRIILLSGSRTRAKRLAEDILNEGLNCFYTEDYDHDLVAGQIMVCYGKVHQGYEYPILQFAVITDTDIFGEEKKKKKRHRTYEGEKIQQFTDLSVGDYVVHENHGLGIYKGIEKIEVDRKVKDYIKIEYGDGGNLYVPATQLDLIQKHSGNSMDGESPKLKLNKLGSSEWSKTKSKVRRAVRDIAVDLVKLYAERQAKSGFQFSPDTIWQTEFEEQFPYTETDDQMTAIEDTKKDMESKKIMDRLICGDVGYGKTEVAIRAAFKAIQDGKQVAFLVPTTILAQQHYNTFTQRMKDFPVTVELMSRFRTPAQQKQAIAGLKSGHVDIVIGTHRILSKDIIFKDLGLLIIDEEQRFGVGHKEKIKQLKSNVDVLSLSATPIPRTLHMSLIGIRDMSVLEEPPVDRLPIQTYVMEFNEEMIREAINRELARNGQVYYVYNRVNNIEEITNEIQKLVPDAVVRYAHGQMSERKLEQIMYEFINGEIDVLVSTTIIETGLDISNVNTMIIHDADKLGLSQLYQLRGRVGRSNRTSYAFLMYKRDKTLKEIAEKRLAAIREFTDLGSGFKIAMRDLEIRGAGNILGAEQHGHMDAVGYDLYCKMLNEAVLLLKGEKTEDDTYETTIDVKMDAYIPPKYIGNEIQKLAIYKRIASIENLEEYQDMQDELTDRFGDIPSVVDNLLKVALIKSSAHAAGMTEISGDKNTLVFHMHPHAHINTDKIPELINKYRGDLKFSTGNDPFFTYKPRKTPKNTKEILAAMQLIIDEIS